MHQETRRTLNPAPLAVRNSYVRPGPAEFLTQRDVTLVRRYKESLGVDAAPPFIDPITRLAVIQTRPGQEAVAAGAPNSRSGPGAGSPEMLSSKAISAAWTVIQGNYDQHFWYQSSAPQARHRDNAGYYTLHLFEI